MPIPQVPPELIRDAMGIFDRELRGAPEWAGWEQNERIGMRSSMMDTGIQ